MVWLQRGRLISLLSIIRTNFLILNKRVQTFYRKPAGHGEIGNSETFAAVLH